MYKHDIQTESVFHRLLDSGFATSALNLRLNNKHGFTVSFLALLLLLQNKSLLGGNDVRSI